jgi:membrane protease YdiL (CAAX protease family)
MLERLALLGALLLAPLLVAIWTFLPVVRGPAAARRDLGTHRLAVASMVIVLAASTILSLPFAATFETAGGFTAQTFLAAALSTQVPMLLFVLARCVLARAVSLDELGLRAIPWSRSVGVGVGFGICMLLVSAGVNLALDRLGLRHDQLDQFVFIQSVSPSEFGMIFLLGAVVAPAIEEIFFRGFLFGLYRRRKPLWVAYAASGLIFAAVHALPIATDPERIAGILVAAFVLASMLAWIYQRTGSLYPGMIAHGVNNGVALSALYVAPMLPT